MAFGIGLGSYPGLYSAQRPTGRVKKSELLKIAFFRRGPLFHCVVERTEGERGEGREGSLGARELPRIVFLEEGPL